MEVKRGYKQTEVGVIPEDWDIEFVEELAHITTGSKNTQDRIDDGQYPFFVRSQTVERINSYSYDGEAVLTAGDGVGTGKVFHYIKGKFDAHQRVYRLSNFNDRISGYFFFLYFSTHFYGRIMQMTAKSSVDSVRREMIARMLIPLPPTKSEQEAIAKALSDADALVESLEQLLVKKRHLKQGAMQELLTGKKRLPGFGGEWEVKRLGETAILKARIGWQGLTTAEYRNTGDYFLVTGTEFKNGYIDWNSCHYVDESRYKQDKYIQLKEHDVLVTKDGTIGKVALITGLPKPATLNSGVFVIRPIEDAFHPEFFYYLLCSNVFTEFLTQLSAGSTINHLYQKDFVSFIYRTPATIKEQVSIAAILSDMDAEIAALETRLAKARQIKQGMMQELLTGRIRLVRSASNVIPFPPKKASTPTAKPHNWQINEAVIIAVLAKHFGSEQWPLARKRCTKLTYLLHRHAEHYTEGYLKKAAGPYNPDTRYKGPEAIAQKNRYVGIHHNGSYEGFVAADNIAEAESYFEKWYGPDVLVWLERFHFKKTDELELLTTVDFTVEELCRDGKAIKLDTVKKVIREHPEWKAKLDREVFCDNNISQAIQSCKELFAE